MRQTPAAILGTLQLLRAAQCKLYGSSRRRREVAEGRNSKHPGGPRNQRRASPVPTIAPELARWLPDEHSGKQKLQGRHLSGMAVLQTCFSDHVVMDAVCCSVLGPEKSWNQSSAYPTEIVRGKLVFAAGDVPGIGPVLGHNILKCAVGGPPDIRHGRTGTEEPEETRLEWVEGGSLHGRLATMAASLSWCSLWLVSRLLQRPDPAFSQLWRAAGSCPALPSATKAHQARRALSPLH